MRKKKKIILKILVIDGNPETRQGLTDYFNSARYRLVQEYGDTKVYKARNISETEEKIIRGLRPCLIMFSAGFPQEEKDNLREWLSYYHWAVPFVTVELSKVAV